MLSFLEEQCSVGCSRQALVRDILCLRDEVVDGHIDHQEHPSRVKSRGQSFEIVGPTEVGVELGRVGRPVSMVPFTVDLPRVFSNDHRSIRSVLTVLPSRVRAVGEIHTAS